MRGVGMVGGRGGAAVVGGGGARGAAGAGAPGGGFAVPGGGAPPGGAAPAATPAAPSLAGVGVGLLALQAAGVSPAPRRPGHAAAAARRDAAARERADSLLAELAGLQRDMLVGSADPDRLARLSALEVGEDGADPALREVVQAIALRAAVELARRGAPGRGSGRG